MRASFVVGLLLGACDAPVEQQRRDVCLAFCDCVTSGSPAELESCIDNDCLPDLPPVEDECLQCVYANSQQCTVLFDDCGSLCLSQATPLLGGMR